MVFRPWSYTERKNQRAIASCSTANSFVCPQKPGLYIVLDEHKYLVVTDYDANKLMLETRSSVPVLERARRARRQHLLNLRRQGLSCAEILDQGSGVFEAVDLTYTVQRGVMQRIKGRSILFWNQDKLDSQALAAECFEHKIEHEVQLGDPVNTSSMGNVHGFCVVLQDLNIVVSLLHSKQLLLVDREGVLILSTDLAFVNQRVNCLATFRDELFVLHDQEMLTVFPAADLFLLRSDKSLPNYRFKKFPARTDKMTVTDLGVVLYSMDHQTEPVWLDHRTLEVIKTPVCLADQPLNDLCDFHVMQDDDWDDFVLATFTADGWDSLRISSLRAVNQKTGHVEKFLSSAFYVRGAISKNRLVFAWSDENIYVVNPERNWLVEHTLTTNTDGAKLSDVRSCAFLGKKLYAQSPHGVCVVDWNFPE